MTDDQVRVVKLMESAKNKEELTPWIRGYIPSHYKKLTIDMDQAISIAKEGAAVLMANFAITPFFTQALIFGAFALKKFRRIICVTPSQYGKSYISGACADYMAHMGEPVYIAAEDGDLTGIIMEKCRSALVGAHYEIKKNLLEPETKIDRMQVSKSKTVIGFSNGGKVETMSFGETYSDESKGNKALGKGGNIIIDEASKISDTRYAEAGRREYANKNGEVYVSLEISNPHNSGRFWDRLTEDETPEDELIIWMDIRTAYEEDNVQGIDYVKNTDFFKHKSQCRRYLLCELEDFSQESLFTEPQIDNGKWFDYGYYNGTKYVKGIDGYTYFLGLDSAYKGADKINMLLGATTKEGKMRMLSSIEVKVDKENWVHGKTNVEIGDQVEQIVRMFDVKMICVDSGKGIYILDELARRHLQAKIKEIEFGSGTDEERKKKNVYSAIYGANKRAEMHLDMQDLIENGILYMTDEIWEMMKPAMNATQLVRKTGKKIGIISKDMIKKKIGHSPDELDSALLCIHANVLYYMQKELYLYS